ncbi:MAG: hypothetical protein EU539_05710 [Promethearchaeota archaeon]|nr:MAG: hypothetical protein EU539_05710 [Candidatus Lokiarchaeota archaeon]
MEIPEFTLIGFLTVYVVQGLVFLFFVTIAYKILKRDAKNENFMLSMFFISAATGFFINFIYALLVDELVVLILYYLTLFFIFLSPIFFLIFNILILKSKVKFNRKKQYTLIIIYAVILLGILMIPNGVKINEQTGWRPIWSFNLFIYLIIIVTFFAVGPGLALSFKIFRKFRDTEIKQRWSCYLIGMCFLSVLMYAIMFANYSNYEPLRMVIGFFGIVLSITGGLLIYMGMARI